MGNVEAEELVETLADVKIIGDTEGDVEGRALVDTLDEPLTDTDAETLGETLGDVKTLALVATLAHTLAEGEVNTVDNTLVDVKALIDKLALTILEVEPETVKNK